MLKKLIKYDFIWINKFMLIFFTISFIVCSLTRIAGNFTDSFIGNILYLILRGCSISCFASTLINCAIRIWARFNLNIYSDESYLTHTLPVSKEILYNSKIISAVLSVAVSLIVILLSFLIVFLDKSMIEQLKNIFNDKTMSFIFVSFIMTVILQLTYMIFCGIIGILIGHKSNNNRMIKSVFMGIGLYFIIQLIIFAIIYGIGIINSGINSLFVNTVNNDIKLESAVKSMVIVVNFIYLIFIASMYFLGRNIFKRGINVE